MPTVEVSLSDLSALAGRKIDGSSVDAVLEYVKGELEDREGDRLKIEIADTNRPDLWSAEGIARELKARMGKAPKGLPEYRTKKSGLKVIVDKNLKGIRPKTVCAVVRGLKMDDETLFQIIQLQEKICETFGRNRREVAIGVYDYKKIKGPISFRAYSPMSIKFTPLDFRREMFLRDILEEHPKGKEYGHLLKGKKMYPVFIDSRNEVLSMPPVINSDYTGKVTKDSTDLFIECSGFDMKYLMPAMNIMVAALADRGGRIETVEVSYPGGRITAPELSPKDMTVDYGYVRDLTGLELNERDIKRLLRRSNYGIGKSEGDRLKVKYPAYRQDIMHQADVVEDIMITYGYNKAKPAETLTPSKGNLRKETVFVRKVMDLALGLGAQEVMSYTLTNKSLLFDRMKMKESKAIEVDNPVSSNWSVFRTWITPQLIEFLGENTDKDYPQEIFEIGKVVLREDSAETRSINPVRLAWASAGSGSNFTRARQCLDFMLRNLGLDYTVKAEDHGSFIAGRCGRVSVGSKGIAYVGEIHPRVLENFGLEQPVCAFELNLTDILDILSEK